MSRSTGKSVTVVRKAKESARIVKFDDKNYYDVLKDKMLT